jgi:hypothetical protein
MAIAEVMMTQFVIFTSVMTMHTILHVHRVILRGFVVDTRLDMKMGGHLKANPADRILPQVQTLTAKHNP